MLWVEWEEIKADSHCGSNPQLLACHELLIEIPHQPSTFILSSPWLPHSTKHVSISSCSVAYLTSYGCLVTSPSCLFFQGLRRSQWRTSGGWCGKSRSWWWWWSPSAWSWGNTSVSSTGRTMAAPRTGMWLSGWPRPRSVRDTTSGPYDCTQRYVQLITGVPYFFD